MNIVLQAGGYFHPHKFLSLHNYSSGDTDIVLLEQGMAIPANIWVPRVEL